MLGRKLYRDLTRNWTQTLAVVLVVLVGAMIFVLSFFSYRNLSASAEAYYREEAFADLTVSLARAPTSAVNRVAHLPGVAAAEGRLTFDVPLYLEGREERFTARLVSLPADRQPRVNRVQVVKGRRIDAADLSAALLESQFAAAHGLKPGDTLSPVIHGREQEFRIVGLIRSPEYVYPAGSELDLLAPGERFGVLFVPEDLLAAVTGYEGSINEVVLRLRPGYPLAPVRRQVEELLEPYGVQRVIPREDQLSNAILQGEMQQWESLAVSLPLLFFAVAAMILYLLLFRAVRAERREIGVLKSLGYTTGQVTFHYLGYALVTALVGSALGVLAGIPAAAATTAMYTRYFNLPALYLRPDWLPIAGILLATLAITGLAAWQAVRGVVGLPPALLLRPEPPGRDRTSLVRWVGRLLAPFSLTMRLAVRHILRSPRKAATVLFGVIASAALMVSTISFTDMMDYLLKTQFEENLTYDLKVTFERPVSLEAVREIGRWEEVRRAEALAELPFTVRRGWREETLVVVGLEPDSGLIRLADKQGETLALPAEGLLLPEQYQAKLDLETGDSVEMKSLLPGGEARSLKVAGWVSQLVGLNGYLALPELARLAGEGPFATGVLVKANPGRVEALKSRFSGLLAVKNVEEPAEMREIFEEYSALFWGFVGVMVVMAGVLSFAVILNSNVVAVLERQRELATLRVIGMEEGRVAAILLYESMLLTGIGVLIGLPAGRLLTEAYVQSLASDLYSLPVLIEPDTYLAVAVLVFLFVWIGQQAGRRRLARLDLVEAFKTYE